MAEIFRPIQRYLSTIDCHGLGEVFPVKYRTSQILLPSLILPIKTNSLKTEVNIS